MGTRRHISEDTREKFGAIVKQANIKAEN